MRLNHNMNAISSFNKYNLNINNDAKAIQKLTSGLKINKAGDDPAALTISEKMRTKIRGLGQAQKTSQDAISLIQVADGAMNEITSMLQRIKQLTVQASNGTVSDDDRSVIQKEINQLLQEVERVSDDTEFNTIPILNGEYSRRNPGETSSLESCVEYVTDTGGVTDTYTYTDANGNTKNYTSAIIDFSNINTKEGVEKLIGKGVNYTCCTCEKAYSIKFVDGDPNLDRLNDENPVMEVDIRDVNNGVDLVEKIKKTAYGEDGFVYDPININNLPNGANSFVDHYSKLAGDGAKLYIYDDREYAHGRSWPSGDFGKFELNVYGETIKDEDKISSLDFQVGNYAGQKITIQLPNTTLKSMELEDPWVSVLTQEDASESITRIDNAIEYMNEERSRMGAYQNRFEGTLNNLFSSEENLQSSESRIRDADMAEYSIEHSKQSILTQASQAMIAQSNEMQKSVLNLMSSWR